MLSPQKQVSFKDRIVEEINSSILSPSVESNALMPEFLIGSATSNAVTIKYVH